MPSFSANIRMASRTTDERLHSFFSASFCSRRRSAIPRRKAVSFLGAIAALCYGQSRINKRYTLEIQHAPSPEGQLMTAIASRYGKKYSAHQSVQALFYVCYWTENGLTLCLVTLLVPFVLTPKAKIRRKLLSWRLCAPGEQHEDRSRRSGPGIARRCRCFLRSSPRTAHRTSGSTGTLPEVRHRFSRKVGQP